MKRYHQEYIVPIYDDKLEGDTPFFVMPYLPKTLSDLLAENSTGMAINLTVDILKQICQGLVLLHENGIVHCDIKPNNILLTANNKVQLADFGMAHIPTSEITTSFNSIGATIDYAAPEQILKAERDKPSIDIFAIGVLAHTMLTHQHYLFNSALNDFEKYELLRTYQKLSPDKLQAHQVPSELIQIIAKTMAKEPVQRYQSAGKLYTTLTTWFEAYSKKPVIHPKIEPKPPLSRVEFSYNIKLGLDTVEVRSDTGHYKTSQGGVNQDYYWLPPQDKILIEYIIAGRLYMVADGVAGGLAGEEASRLACEHVGREYYEAIKNMAHYPTDDELQNTLRSVIISGSQYLLEQSKVKRDKEGITNTTSYLQTTMACALLRGKTLIVAYVGDSRIYQLRDFWGFLRAIHFPPEHQEEQMFMGARQLTEQKVLIYQPTDWRLEDKLLLCTDGFYKYASLENNPKHAPKIIEQMSANYQKYGWSEIVDRLLAQANDAEHNGGRDNITIMLIDREPLRYYAATLLEEAWHDPKPEIRERLSFKYQAYHSRLYNEDKESPLQRIEKLAREIRYGGVNYGFWLGEKMGQICMLLDYDKTLDQNGTMFKVARDSLLVLALMVNEDEKQKITIISFAQFLAKKYNIEEPTDEISTGLEHYSKIMQSYQEDDGVKNELVVRLSQLWQVLQIPKVENSPPAKTNTPPQVVKDISNADNDLQEITPLAKKNAHTNQENDSQANGLSSQLSAESALPNAEDKPQSQVENTPPAKSNTHPQVAIIHNDISNANQENDFQANSLLSQLWVYLQNPSDTFIALVLTFITVVIVSLIGVGVGVILWIINP